MISTGLRFAFGLTQDLLSFHSFRIDRIKINCIVLGNYCLNEADHLTQCRTFTIYLIIIFFSLQICFSNEDPFDFETCSKTKSALGKTKKKKCYQN